MTTVAEMPPRKANKSKDEPAKGAKSGQPKGDRHKDSYQVRINLIFLPGLTKLAELHGREVPDEIREAVREYLQKHNLWPKSVDEVRGGTE